jgi:hypothetical protein
VTVDAETGGPTRAPAPDARRWAGSTRTFDAVGHRFAVRTTREGLGRLLDDAYAVHVTTEPPTHWYSVVDDLPGEWPHALLLAHDVLARSADPATILGHLVWHVNQQVIAAEDRVLVHAGAVAHGDRAVLLPAAMEAGKTTLVAGLLLRGYRYLSDEAAVIDPSTLQVLPYAKPLSVDPGSWPVLPGLRPQVLPDTVDYLARQWQVPIGAVPGGEVAAPSVARLLVFPTYRAGAATTVEPVRRAEALLAVLRQTFHLHRAGGDKLDTLARVVEGTACYRLVSGDLVQACDAVEDLLDRTSRDVEVSRG